MLVPTEEAADRTVDPVETPEFAAEVIDELPEDANAIDEVLNRENRSVSNL